MIQIRPAIDILEGRCVRLTEGNFSRCTVYGDDPLEVALRFKEAGVCHLHIVDLDGAKLGRPVHTQIVRQIIGEAIVEVTLGGGIRTTADVEQALGLGVSEVCIGSTAVRDPHLFREWLTVFGPHRLRLAADVRGGMIVLNGWSESSTVCIEDFLTLWVRQGVTKVLCTEIERDGTLDGPATALYKKVRTVFPMLDLAASGGVRSVEDVRLLSELGVSSVVIGKAFYEGHIMLTELQAYGSQKSNPVP